MDDMQVFQHNIEENKWEELEVESVLGLTHEGSMVEVRFRGVSLICQVLSFTPAHGDQKAQLLIRVVGPDWLCRENLLKILPETERDYLKDRLMNPAEP